MDYFIIIGLPLILGIVLAIILGLILNKSAAIPSQPKLSGLELYLSQDRSYLYYVGMPLHRPQQWALAQAQGKDLNVEGHPVLLPEITAYVIAYPGSKQVIDSRTSGLPLPEGVNPGLYSRRNRSRGVIDPGKLDPRVLVTHGPSRGKGEEEHYCTKLKNEHNEKVRVLRFGAYVKSKGAWTLHTVTGAHYSADQFCEWYGLGESGWMKPGHTVSDLNNYGAGPLIWVYFCVDESRNEFMAGEQR